MAKTVGKSFKKPDTAPKKQTNKDIKPDTAPKKQTNKDIKPDTAPKEQK